MEEKRVHLELRQIESMEAVLKSFSSCLLPEGVYFFYQSLHPYLRMNLAMLNTGFGKKKNIIVFRT